MEGDSGIVARFGAGHGHLTPHLHPGGGQDGPGSHIQLLLIYHGVQLQVTDIEFFNHQTEMFYRICWSINYQFTKSERFPHDYVKTTIHAYLRYQVILQIYFRECGKVQVMTTFEMLR